jgi:hypothetical protein
MTRERTTKNKMGMFIFLISCMLLFDCSILRLHGIIFIFDKTLIVSKYSYKVTVITLVDIDFGSKNNANHF